MMMGISFIQVTVVAFVFFLSIATRGVDSSFIIEPSSYHTSRQQSSSTWQLMPRINYPKVGSSMEENVSISARSSISLCAAKGTNDNKPAKKKPMVGYNDDAFGLIFLTGGILSQDADFVVTFVALSAIAAIASNASQEINDTRLPGLVAMATLPLTPVVTYLHAAIMMADDGQGGSIVWTAPQPIEIGLCFVSLAWSYAKWTQEQNQ
ncbi:unnamed protein product [Cylindrotheca closterium]|uniref:Mitochondrial pyruvate carrier n=1 Tax=Cylindrotheca closterium TaxID=2856 RepID=A0AAD2FNG7_9STRA|nr:unnamed protein product [Cylindrotheca closterium]